MHLTRLWWPFVIAVAVLAMPLPAFGASGESPASDSRAPNPECEAALEDARQNLAALPRSTPFTLVLARLQRAGEQCGFDLSRSTAKSSLDTETAVPASAGDSPAVDGPADCTGVAVNGDLRLRVTFTGWPVYEYQEAALTGQLGTYKAVETDNQKFRIVRGTGTLTELKITWPGTTGASYTAVARVGVVTLPVTHAYGRIRCGGLSSDVKVKVGGDTKEGSAFTTQACYGWGNGLLDYIGRDQVPGLAITLSTDLWAVDPCVTPDEPEE